MGTLCMLNPAAGQIRARTEWITTVRPTRFSMPPVGRGCMVLRRRHRDMNRERDMGPSSSHHHHLQHHYGGASRDKMVSFSHSSSSLSSSSSSSHCLNLKRSIKSGEIIEYHGSIVVHGNVQSGAIMRAGGNIIVLGYIEGEVHAGTNGDEDAIIFALRLGSKSLIIDGCAARRSQSGETAFLPGGKLRVETIMDDRQASVSQNWVASNRKSARKASKVALFTGAYISLVGLALLAFPECLFGAFFDLKQGVNEWIRVGAVLAIVFGVYYIGTAWGDMNGVDGAQSFYLSTVVGRIFLFLSFSWLVVTGSAPFPVFIMGVVNLLGAMSMLYALYTPKRQ